MLLSLILVILLLRFWETDEAARNFHLVEDNKDPSLDVVSNGRS